MKLTVTFSEAIKHAGELVSLFDALASRNQRSARSEWVERFFDAKLTTWPKRDGLWRSRNDALLIVGRGNTGLPHRTFSSESLGVFLRAALFLAMSAVDKVLHEAVSKHFVTLVRNGKLDGLVDIELSKTYKIARESQVRRGPGGRIRSRLAHKIKAEVLDKIYRESFISLRRLQEICAACGKDKIFKRYGRSLHPRRRSESLQSKWSALYMRRNQIGHECDIVRKSKAQRIHIHRIIHADTKTDIEFIKHFGLFLARELERATAQPRRAAAAGRAAF